MENKQAAELISSNLKNIYGYAFARLYDKEDVDDLTSEIVYEVLNSADRIKSDEAFWAFMWKTAENTFRKFIRKKDRQNQFLPLPEEDSVCEAVDSAETTLLEREESDERLNLLRRELSLLSKTHREVCLAYYFQNKSCKEIAAEQNLSLEMVKYHLFKTRQLLKEGIGMERTFGLKSYNPAKFEFQTILPGQMNREYMDLFRRKLPGNILHSAYYTPMTIRELSLELGVSSVYMEDEVALLEKYKLLTALPGGKYQTSLIIFTSAYMTELFSKTKELATEKIAAILRDTRALLPALRAIRFRGSNLEDDRLLWPLLWLLMLRGQTSFDHKLPEFALNEMNVDAMGIHFGTDFEKPHDEEYDCGLFAGVALICEAYAVSFADFGVLPEDCRVAGKEADVEEAVLSGSEAYPFFTKKELALVEETLQPQINAMAALYGELSDTAVKLMKQHAPKSVMSLVETVITKSLFFQTIGFLGRCAVQSGELRVPNNGKPVAIFAFEAKAE